MYVHYHVHNQHEMRKHNGVIEMIILIMIIIMFDGLTVYITSSINQDFTFLDSDSKK